jgi:hypothetical protein
LLLQPQPPECWDYETEPTNQFIKEQIIIHYIEILGMLTKLILRNRSRHNCLYEKKDSKSMSQWNLHRNADKGNSTLIFFTPSRNNLAVTE